MSKTFLIIPVALSLAVMILPYSGGDAAVGQDQKPAAKPSPAEIDALIKDLGSPSFATREKATKRLRDTPSALHQLRRSLKGHDVETTARMVAVIDELARKRFHLRLTELAKEKTDAPLDLLTELLLEYRGYVGDEQWKQTVEIVSTIAENLFKEKNDPAKFADRMRNLEIGKCEDLIGGVISLERAVRRRVIADRFVTKVTASCVVVSHALDPFINAEAILLINGTIKVGQYDGCFIYCDADFSSSSGGSMIIARGRVHTGDRSQILRKFVFENARNASNVKLFSLERVGMNVRQEGNQTHVESVTPASRSDKCGFKRGDVIRFEKKTADAISDLERMVRQAYVKDTDLEFSIVREGRQQKLVLSFVD